MTQRDAASVQAEVSIDADPATVYHLITDLPTLASLAEENEAMEWRKGDKVLGPACDLVGEDGDR